MADGVTWSQRSPSDWLASNGKWYPSSKYPRGWETSALPPAPGQGGMGSVLREFATKATNSVGVTLGAVDRIAANSAGASNTAAPPPPAPPTSSGAPGASGASTSAQPRKPVRTKSPPRSQPASSQQTSGFSVMDPGRRRVADATVTNERDYAHKVGAGKPPPRQLQTPPPPGRVAAPPAPSSSVPAVQKPPPPPAKRPVVNEDGGINFDVVAGDFGKILGGAKKRIEKALNEPLDKG